MSWISALTCLVIPLLIILAVRRAVIQQRERMVLRSQHPNEPWLWRRDWASKSAVDLSSSYSPLIWLLAVVWNLISVPVFFIVRGRRPDPIFLMFVLFPIVGVILLIVAAYQTMRRARYGLTVCRFDPLPIPLGRTLHGEVETRVRELPAGGFLVRLTSLRRVVHSSGKSTSVSERILWQDEQRVGSGAATPGPNGVRVPFRFAVPVEGEATDDTDSRNRVIWRLEVVAEVPGIDYRGVFELPVFTRAEAQESATFSTAFETPWTPPSQITFSDNTITIRPSPGAMDVVFYVVFLAIWFTALGIIYKLGGPIWAVGFFALIGLVVLYFALDYLAGRSTVTADRTQLVSRSRFLGTRTIPTADITKLEPSIGNTSGRRAWYDLEARLQSGRTVTIARYLRTRRDAEMVAGRLMRALGRPQIEN